MANDRMKTKCVKSSVVHFIIFFSCFPSVRSCVCGQHFLSQFLFTVATFLVILIHIFSFRICHLRFVKQWDFYENRMTFFTLNVMRKTKWNLTLSTRRERRRNHSQYCYRASWKKARDSLVSSSKNQKQIQANKRERKKNENFILNEIQMNSWQRKRFALLSRINRSQMGDWLFFSFSLSLSSSKQNKYD